MVVTKIVLEFCDVDTWYGNSGEKTEYDKSRENKKHPVNNKLLFT